MRYVVVVGAAAVLGAAASGQSPPRPLPPSLTQPAAQPAGPGPEHLRSFDPRAVRVAWNDRRWQLVHQGEVLKDFGPRERDARVALRLIHEYGLNQHGVVGSPQPVMEYWLRDGQPPRGLVGGGLRAVPLDPSRLRVERLSGQWALRDGPLVLFAFGPREQEARQALAVIQKYGFHQVGVVGQGAPAMYVFLGRSGEGAAKPALASAPTRSTAPGKFARGATNPDGSPRVEQPAGKAEHPLAGVVAPVLPSLPATPQRPSAGGHRPEVAWRVKAPAALGPAERMTFDWRQVQIKQVKGEWKMVAGSTVLSNFGTNAHDARLALAAMRHYRFTEQHRVGEQPALTYYVPSAQAPRGAMLGLSATPIEAKHLGVQPLADGYAVCQGSRVLVRMGPRQADAQKLLETIKTNSFDRLCQIGDPGKPAMTILVRSR